MSRQRDGEVETLLCISSFATEIDGVPANCLEGELVDADDPRVAMRPFAFCPPSMSTAQRKQQLYDAYKVA